MCEKHVDKVSEEEELFSRGKGRGCMNHGILPT